MKKIKNILRRLKIRKLTTFFVIFGLVASMLMISFNISFIWALKEEERITKKLSPPNSYIVPFIGRDLAVEDIAENLSKSVDEYTGAYLSGLILTLDNAKTSEYYELSTEWFGQYNNWEYPILEGRYYTHKEINEGKKVALVGKGLKKYVNDDNTISVYGDSYDIVGIVGLEDKQLPWDLMIFMPMTSLPSEGLEVGLRTDFGGQVPLVIYNNKGNTLAQIDKFTSRGKNNWDEFRSSEPIYLYGYMLLDDIVIISRDFKFIMIILYVAAIIQSIATMIFWIDSMKFEIGIRKAIGHTNFQIGKLIYSDIFVITLSSYIISLLIQGIMNLYISNIGGYDISLRIENLTIGVLVVIVTSLTTSIYPILKSFKVQPTEAMKF